MARATFHQLIAAYADLGPHGFEGDLVPEMREGLLPGPGMKIDGIHQRFANAEEDRLSRYFSFARHYPDGQTARGGGGPLPGVAAVH